MSTQYVDTSGLDNQIEFLQRLDKLDPLPALEECKEIIVEDNRAGVLSGLNKDGQPYSPALTYRGGFGKKTGYRRTNFAMQRAPGKPGGFGGTSHRTTFNVKAGGRFKPTHRGTQTGAANNNLTTAQYKKLTGPFAAPRRQFSRIITNFIVKQPMKLSDGLWQILAGWHDVVDTKGRPFYGRLFAPPGRDYRGIRPTGMTAIRAKVVEWFHYAVRQAQGH